MSYETARAAIEGHFSTQWGATTAVHWANTEFSRDGVAEYVAFTVLPGTGGQISIGSSVDFRTFGLVQVDIFTRQGIGTGRASALATLATNALRGRQADPVLFRGHSLRPHPSPPEGFYGLLLTVEFQHDEIVTNPATL